MKETKITLFGDSIAKGLEIKDGKPVKLKDNAVNIVENYFNITIDNKSCFGQSIARLCRKKIIEQFIETIDETKNNVVVFNLGGNDVDFDWRAVADNPLLNHDCKTPLKNFINCYNHIISLLKANNIKVYLCTLPPLDANLFFNNYISKLVDGKKVMQFFDGDVTNIIRKQEIYNQTIINIANYNNIGLIDLRTKFLNCKNLANLYAEDGMHPNIEGQKLIAETIINFIKVK